MDLNFTEPNNTEQKYDVIVIGSGMGGLGCAATLSSRNKKVLVVERNSFVGGNCSSFLVDSKYRFDFAVHQISGMGHGGLGNDILRDIGIENRIDFIPIDPMFTAIYPDSKMVFPIDFDKLSQNFCNEFPEEAKNIKRFLKRSFYLRIASNILMVLSSKWKIGLINLKKVKLIDFIKMPFSGFMQIPKLFTTTKTELNKRFNNETIKEVLPSLWGYGGMPPDRMSALMLDSIITGAHLEKTYYPKGGSQNLSENLAKFILEKNNHIVVNEKISKILTKGNKAIGIELSSGKKIYSKFIVSNANPYQVFSSMLEQTNRVKNYLKKLDKLELSISCIKVFIATDLDLEALDINCYEYLYFKDYNHRNMYDKTNKGDIQYLGAYIPTLIDKSLAPEGVHNIILTTLIPFELQKNLEDKQNNNILADQMITLAEEFIPGLKDRIIAIKINMPGDLIKQTLTVNGAMYGWANSVYQSYIFRLKQKTAIKNLYLTGHYTKPGSGISAAFMSGWLVAQKLLKKQTPLAIIISVIVVFLTGMGGGTIAAITGLENGIYTIVGYYIGILIWFGVKNQI